MEPPTGSWDWRFFLSTIQCCGDHAGPLGIGKIAPKTSRPQLRRQHLANRDCTVDMLWIELQLSFTEAASEQAQRSCKTRRLVRGLVGWCLHHEATGSQAVEQHLAHRKHTAMFGQLRSKFVSATLLPQPRKYIAAETKQPQG